MMTAEEVDAVLDMLQRHMQARLDEWEAGFVRSCAEQRARGTILSLKALDRLDAIAERCAREYSRGA